MTNLIFIDTPINEVKIQLTNKIKNETWQEIMPLNNEVSCFRGYLNLLARKIFISWFNLILDTNFIDTMNLEDNLSIWEFVNGNAIEIDFSRIILIPIETQDKIEFSIPEEWLKIPQWVGNYYLPIEINVEQNYVNFCGYTTYEDLLIYSKLDSFNHCLDFPFECLETDLNLICLEYEYGWNCIPEISPFPLLSTSLKQNLYPKIQHHLSPRLLLNFSEWLSFISDKKTRYELFFSRKSLNLSQWLNNQFTSALVKGWQNLDDFKQHYFIPDFNFITGFSSRSFSFNDSLSILEDNIDKIAINNILKNINNIEINSLLKPKIIKNIVNIINKNQNDEETRWNAVLALQILDPYSSFSAIWQGKIIQIKNNNLCLLMGILPKNKCQVDIFIRVYNTIKNTYLPNNLELQIIDDNNNIFASIITNNDMIIQYKFWGNQKENFNIKILLDNDNIQEKFII